MRELVVYGLAGAASVALPVWREVRVAWALRRALGSEPRARMRRQMYRQYWAEYRVRRELTLDPWFGSGGRLLFSPDWSDVMTTRRGTR